MLASCTLMPLFTLGDDMTKISLLDVQYGRNFKQIRIFTVSNGIRVSWSILSVGRWDDFMAPSYVPTAWHISVFGKWFK